MKTESNNNLILSNITPLSKMNSNINLPHLQHHNRLNSALSNISSLPIYNINYTNYTNAKHSSHHRNQSNLKKSTTKTLKSSLIYQSLSTYNTNSSFSLINTNQNVVKNIKNITLSVKKGKKSKKISFSLTKNTKSDVINTEANQINDENLHNVIKSPLLLSKKKVSFKENKEKIDKLLEKYKKYRNVDSECINSIFRTDTKDNLPNYYSGYNRDNYYIRTPCKVNNEFKTQMNTNKNIDVKGFTISGCKRKNDNDNIENKENINQNMLNNIIITENNNENDHIAKNLFGTDDNKNNKLNKLLSRNSNKFNNESTNKNNQYHMHTLSEIVCNNQKGKIDKEKIVITNPSKQNNNLTNSKTRNPPSKKNKYKETTSITDSNFDTLYNKSSDVDVFTELMKLKNNKLLLANLSDSKKNQLFNNGNKKNVKKSSMMDKFIFKLADPNECVEDYFVDDGGIKRYDKFKKFKKLLKVKKNETDGLLYLLKVAQNKTDEANRNFIKTEFIEKNSKKE